jgi:signal transduction histidine kinase
MANVQAGDILAAAEFLAERELFGLVWLDARMVATERFGKLADGVPLGVAITASVLPLMGFEEQIQAMQRQPSQSLVIPNVLMDATRRDGQRLNIAVYWMDGQRRYLTMFSSAVSATDLEVVLAAQVRARAIAEADVAAKSRLIAKANEELTRANQDLQEFAYVISHDLRAPLRALRYFASDAAEAVAQENAAQAARHLERVRDQAKRMAAMLTGLLEYSSVGRRTDALENVDLRALVAEIAQSVERPGGVRIRVDGDWPSLRTVAQPLDIILRNLIDNAVKHHDRSDGTVTVRCHDDGEVWGIVVADDGPGIETEWQQAIFEPFSRGVGGDEAADGAGIGLALVKKTVQWFGGRIEVISDPHRGRGTTFRVGWPKVLRHDGR